MSVNWEARRGSVFHELRALLARKGIVVEEYGGLTPKERKQLRELFLDTIFPLLTPQSIDPAHPFPFISNLSLNLLVTFW